MCVCITDPEKLTVWVAKIAFCRSQFALQILSQVANYVVPPSSLPPPPPPPIPGVFLGPGSNIFGRERDTSFPIPLTSEVICLRKISSFLPHTDYSLPVYCYKNIHVLPAEQKIMLVLFFITGIFLDDQLFRGSPV